uniref:PhoLip_ATPase_C domain-containing protein n=2 Tax=Caenorhabditis tropicalis TaxID=1561998 RepID=A0A1I7UA22_9PELO
MLTAKHITIPEPENQAFLVPYSCYSSVHLLSNYLLNPPVTMETLFLISFLDTSLSLIFPLFFFFSVEKMMIDVCVPYEDFEYNTVGHCADKKHIQVSSTKKDNDEHHFSYFNFYLLQFLTTMAHIYQFCTIQTFIIPVIFPQFAGDYLIIFRYVTGVLAVRFMVSIIFATGPLLLLPPIRRQIFRPILKKIQQDKVAAAPSEVRSADQIHVSFVN